MKKKKQKQENNQNKHSNGNRIEIIKKTIRIYVRYDETSVQCSENDKSQSLSIPVSPVNGESGSIPNEKHNQRIHIQTTLFVFSLRETNVMLSVILVWVCLLRWK